MDVWSIGGMILLLLVGVTLERMRQSVLRARWSQNVSFERGERRATCACVLTTPCCPSCTCVNSITSGGCLRCATYGSTEQRKKAAESIARQIPGHGGRNADEA